jgi:hypothetical protein
LVSIHKNEAANPRRCSLRHPLSVAHTALTL